MKLTSVIIPMRNARAFVAETISSVLAGNRSAIEVIVVDDGSTDGSGDLVRAMNDPRVKVIPGPSRGIAAAFNAGLAAATGDLICRCDADDLYPLGRIDWQRAWLDAHADFGAVCGTYSTLDPRGILLVEHNARLPAADVTAELLDGRGRSHMCAYAFRAELLRQIGGCREWFVTSEDADIQFRIAAVAPVAFEPRSAYLYRLHDASITHSQKNALRLFYAEQCLKFARQRKHGGKDDLERGEAPAIPSGGVAVAQSTSAQIHELLLGEAWMLHREGRRWDALATGFRACRWQPFRGRAWVSLAALLLKGRSGAAPVPGMNATVVES